MGERVVAKAADDEDEAEEGRSSLAAAALLLAESFDMVGLRGTGDVGSRGGRPAAADGRVNGERGEEGTGDRVGERVGDLPNPLLVRSPVLPVPPAAAAAADDERVRDAPPPPMDADDADEDDRGDGEAAERGDKRVEAVETVGRCSFDCTVRGGLPIRLANVLGLDGTTRGGDECVDEVV